MDCKQIAVVGRSFNSEKWQDIFDALDAGVEAGKICYEKYNIDQTKDIPESDGYLYIATSVTRKDKPYTHFPVSILEDQIFDKMQEFVSELFKEVEDVTSDIGNTECIADSIDCDVSVLNGLVVEYDGKSFKLNRSDMEQLQLILGIAKEYKFEVKEILFGDNK